MKIQEYVIFVTNKTGIIFLFVSSRKNVYINKKWNFCNKNYSTVANK